MSERLTGFALYHPCSLAVLKRWHDTQRTSHLSISACNVARLHGLFTKTVIVQAFFPLTWSNSIRIGSVSPQSTQGCVSKFSKTQFLNSTRLAAWLATYRLGSFKYRVRDSSLWQILQNICKPSGFVLFLWKSVIGLSCLQYEQNFNSLEVTYGTVVPGF